MERVHTGKGKVFSDLITKILKIFINYLTNEIIGSILIVENNK